MRCFRIAAATALVLFVVAPLGAETPVIIGEYVHTTFETPHPYPALGGPHPQLTWVEEIVFPGATYVAPHFERFDLAPGDFVVVRSADARQTWTYTGAGRHHLGTEPGGFFATHIKGDHVVIELFTVGERGGFGFRVDYYGRGYSEAELVHLWDIGKGEEMNLAVPAGWQAQNESLCGTDDSLEAKCYQTTEPQVYDKSRAVARLMLSGSAHCTGWLIGNEGHVMTNEHCIGSQSQLDSIDFEFMAEGADCITDCTSSLACPGTIEASGGTLVRVDAPLDYSLVLPDTSVGGGTDLPATYGFMQLRQSGAVVGERMYISQHPAGWGKRIALESTHTQETNPPWASVVSVSETACATGGPPDVGYWADTQGGSSGSPVLAYSDHRIIALHHCRGSAACSQTGGDPNRGVPIPEIITDLGPDLPNGATCDPPTAPTGLTATANGDNQIDLSWTPVEGPSATEYKVYRAVGACPQTAYTLLVEGLTGTAYSDTDVSGGTTYSYVVASFDTTETCESPFSACADATATGTCFLPPAFDGAVAASDSGGASCAVEVSWNAGAANCGSTLYYNVYRDLASGFTPDAGNQVASCLQGTSYLDPDVSFGQDYFYVVRAEDDAGTGPGACAAGNVEENLVEVSATPTQVATIFEDDMEAGTANWAAEVGPNDGGGTQPWATSTGDAHSPVTSWFVSDEPIVKDQVLRSNAAFAISSGNQLQFWHRFDTESGYDGGVLEYSADGGTTWLDILDGNPARFIEGGYNDTLSDCCANPMPLRAAWSGTSGGWMPVIVDLADFDGQSLMFRWRMGCDNSVSATGWWLDDVRIATVSACSSDVIFADGFESGDTSAWSVTTP